MQRAIARQAEAERERRAKIISADGEFQAAEKLAQAANIISLNPATLQLRYLQTLLDIGVNQNSTIIFPLPLDLIKPFLGFDCARRPARPRRQRARPPKRSRAAVSAPEVRIDQLTGLRASSRRAGPSGPTPSPRVAGERARGRRRDAARSARAARTARRRRSGRAARRRRARLAGLDGPRGAEPLPGARRRPGGRAPRRRDEPAAGARDRPGELDRPAAAPRPGRASPTCSRPSPPRAPTR